MSKQMREVYQTGNPQIDRILMQIANRLDIIEGLRPDISAGLLTLTSSKNINTTDPDNFLQLADGVTLAANSITITNGTLTLIGSTLKLEESTLEVYDSGDVVIHKIE